MAHTDNYFKTDKTVKFREYIKKQIGDMNFTVEEIRDFFNQADKIDATLMKDRPLTAQVLAVDLQATLRDLTATFGRAGVITAIVQNPRLLLEEYEPEEKPKKRSNAPAPSQG